MYKEILKTVLNKRLTVADVISLYARRQIYVIHRETDSLWELVFNEQYNSIVKIPKIDGEAFARHPMFYLDDDDILLDVNQLLCVVLIERFNSFKFNHKIKYHNFINKDLSLLNKYNIDIPSYSYNNIIKLRNRIRVLKTYKKNGNKKIYYNFLSYSLQDMNIPNSSEDIKKYSKLFSEPINVVLPSKGVYCSNKKGIYKGIGYQSTQDSITSIFPSKSNLPERLRQHYTSNYIEPSVKMEDLLTGKKECGIALCVFLPINIENKEDSPFPNYTLVGGELLINDELSKRKYNVRRTYSISGSDIHFINNGTKLHFGDSIAYNIEGETVLRYDLNYDEAVLDSVEYKNGMHTVVLTIENTLSVSRVISDYGLKGVTHPVGDLGVVKIPESIFGENLEIGVEMVVGPNSIKSGSNGVRLAWLALKQSLLQETNIVSPENITEERVNFLTKDIQKIDWHYKGKVYKVYCGVIAFGVTDSSKDCSVDKIRVMPETLKYMYISRDKDLSNVADILCKKYTNDTDKWTIEELINIKLASPTSGDEVWTYDDMIFIKKLNDTYFDISDWSSVKINVNKINSILLSPTNKGFYVKIEDNYIKFPSSRLIRLQSNIRDGIVNYPGYYTYALSLLYSIKLYNYNKCDKKTIDNNTSSYLFNIDEEIYEKKSVLSGAISPLVDGGHFKQLISPLVPRGVTVILDNKLNSKINEFRAKNNWIMISDIGVRNPILWSYQLAPKKVWTLNSFTSYLKHKNIDPFSVIKGDSISGVVLRNSIDALLDQSDTDGDLYPVSIPLDRDIQLCLTKYIYHHPINKLEDYEDRWAKKYINGEIDSDKIKDIENKPFKYYTISKDNFSNLFASAAIAKNDVGPGTIDLWKFHISCEYLNICDAITDVQMRKMMFTFSMIVQDYIVRGIKHVDGGSSNYNIYNLRHLKEKDVLIDLQKTFYLNEEEAMLFVKIADFTKKAKYLQFLARLCSGGETKSMQRLASVPCPISQEKLEKLSYYKIIKKYYNFLAYNTSKELDAKSSLIGEEYEC